MKCKLSEKCKFGNLCKDATRHDLIGHIDLLEMWKQNIHNGTFIGCYNRHYDENGQKRTEDI